MQSASEKKPSTFSRVLAMASMSLALIAVLCLGALHLMSPELDPSWHMVSEYAYGKHGLLLRVFFLCWGIGGIASAAALFPLRTKWWHALGAVFVFLSGVGAIGGGVFDIHHDLHGLAFALGVPTLPIGALLLTGLLANHAPKERRKLQISAHATWLSIVAMGVAMALFIGSLKAAGAFHPESKQVLEALPPGVTSVSGYANRLLVLVYLAWLVIAGAAVRTEPLKSA